MNIRQIKIILALILAVVGLTGCTVSYSLSGASIAPEIQTVSIAQFQNNALMVSPIFSTSLTEGLQERFVRQTRLSVLREGGDMHFEGTITNYVSTPAAISADEYAQRNKLTVTVRVRFTNSVQPEYDFDRTFTAFSEYDSSTLLQDAEDQLIPEIVDQLVEDIFNAAVSNW